MLQINEFQIMQTLKHLAISLLKCPPASQIKPVGMTTLTNLVRNFSLSPPAPLYLTQSLDQKKAQKLFKDMRGGGENGGVDYGWEVMERNRKGPHRKVRPNKNPLGPGVPFAKGIVIKPVIKKPKKPNSANRKVDIIFPT